MLLLIYSKGGIGMGLFGNNNKKLYQHAMSNAKTGTVKCKYCGRSQRLTYFPNDSWACRGCGKKNYISK